MKKIFILSLGILLLGMGAKAQNISENALGLRIGGGEGFGPEITYQRLLFDNNRLEIDLGLRNNSDFDAVKLVGLYQWVWHLDGNFNWYAGVGGGIGSISDSRKKDHRHDDGVFVNVAGDIGIEYNFDIPLQLALDFRPEIALVNYDVYNSFGPDFALSIRYRF